MSRSTPFLSIYVVSKDLCACQWTATFDKKISQCRAIRDELRLDSRSFNRVSSLCVCMRSVWVRKRTLHRRSHEKSGEIPHLGNLYDRPGRREPKWTVPELAAPSLTALAYLYTIELGTTRRSAGTISISRSAFIFDLTLTWVFPGLKSVLAI